MMSVAFQDMLSWLVSTVSSFLMAEPMIYFVALLLLCFVVKLVFRICGKEV